MAPSLAHEPHDILFPGLCIRRDCGLLERQRFNLKNFKAVLVSIISAAAALSPGAIHAQSESKIVSGNVVAGKCSLTCKSAGFTSKHCREWRNGDKCYVQALDHNDQTADNKTANNATSRAKPAASPSAVPDIAAKISGIRSLTPEQKERMAARGEIEKCEKIHPVYQIPSSVKIESLKDAGYTQHGKFSVKGSVRGMCIKAAAFYVDGELMEQLPVKPSTRYQSFPFQLTFRSDTQSEIRVYPVVGERNVVRLKPEEQ
jgi:hypothetical protein